MSELNKRRVAPPITGRPDFGATRWFKNRYVRLVAYISDEEWYWVPLESHATAPKREMYPWRMLKEHP